jgi:hypothetical protein
MSDVEHTWGLLYCLMPEHSIEGTQSSKPGDEVCVERGRTSGKLMRSTSDCDWKNGKELRQVIDANRAA